MSGAFARRAGLALRHRLRLAGAAALDGADRLRGRRGLMPPRRLLGADYSEYERIGREFRGHLVDRAGLTPESAVLDVGCGPGRMAVPLTEHLSAEGRYEGFDVVPREVRWCQDNITPRFPSFRFRHVDVINERYNPRGAVRASELRFPYEDDSFDIVVLASVFTHMRAGDVEHYMSEIARVLRAGGRCFATYFLLNADSRRRIEAGESHFTFAAGDGVARFEDAADPEAAVAYEEDFVRELHERMGVPVRSIDYGYWCGRAEYLTWQDVVVGERG